MKITLKILNVSGWKRFKKLKIKPFHLFTIKKKQIDYWKLNEEASSFCSVMKIGAYNGAFYNINIFSPHKSEKIEAQRNK